MTRIGQLVQRIVRLFRRNRRLTALCGYCDIVLTGQPVAVTDRYDAVCAVHVQHGEIEDDEADLTDPDAVYDRYRDARAGV